MMMLMVVFVMFVLATMLMFVMMSHNSFLLILLRCKGTQNVMQLGCKPLLVKVFATELHEISKKKDHSQKPVLRKKTRKALTCAAVLCEHSFKGVAQVLYKQVCQSLPATLEQPTA